MLEGEAGSAAREWERAVLFGLVAAPSWRSGVIAALRWWALELVVALLMVLGAPAAAALANTYLVSNGNGSGPGSLRAAITMANSHPGADTVTSAPGIGQLKVNLHSALPRIGQEIVIDFLEGDPDRPLVIGSNGPTGLVLAPGSGRSTLEGLSVHGATRDGILVSSNGNLIQGVTVGNTITRNHNGIYVQSNNNTIGGMTANTADTIVASAANGLVIGPPSGGTADGNVVEGNFIGTDPAGDGGLGNRGAGLLIDGGARANTIGGTASGQGNTIAFNLGGGVVLSGAMTLGDPLFGNVIFSSGPNRSGPAIKLVGGAARNEPAPVITSATPSAAGVTIKGTGAPKTRIEVFTNPSCGDPEGRRFLAATATSAGGSWTLAGGGLEPGTGVTATQTSPARNTSPFSRCVSAQ